MYLKIAIGNVKKNYQDYVIYFLTLVLAVGLFYGFNSVTSQKVLSTIQYAKVVDFMNRAMAILSIFVTIVFGYLILYANNFLIKRRKKELGIYMSLGMKKREIARILRLETLTIGIGSLLIGLVVGILGSQLLSILTLSLFEIPLSEFAFAISFSAIAKTILFFGVVFVIVLLFNTSIVARFKIIDLLAASRKNERKKDISLTVCLVTFAASVAILIYAYQTALSVKLDLSDMRFIFELLAGVAGTVLFFFSISGLALNLAKRNQRFYLKHLHIFTVKQLSTKVRTNFVTMSVICLMLFFAITVLFSGISLKKSLESGLALASPFDASVVLYTDDEPGKLGEVLNQIGYQLGNDEKYAYANIYFSDMRFADLIPTDNVYAKNSMVTLLKLSDYNQILQLRGQPSVSLKSDEALVISDVSNNEKIINQKLTNDKKITIGQNQYQIVNNSVLVDNLYTTQGGVPDNECTFVLNDEALVGYKSKKQILNINYVGKDAKTFNDKYEQIDEQLEHKTLNADIGINELLSNTKNNNYFDSRTDTTMVLYIGLYLGIVCLIAGMAMLSLQQLSSAVDSSERYVALRRMGADRRMINQTIFAQLLVYFGLPLALALVHAAIGSKVVESATTALGGETYNTYSVIVALGLFLVIYCSYFFATYVEYQRVTVSRSRLS